MASEAPLAPVRRLAASTTSPARAVATSRPWRRKPSRADRAAPRAACASPRASSPERQVEAGARRGSPAGCARCPAARPRPRTPRRGARRPAAPGSGPAPSSTGTSPQSGIRGASLVVAASAHPAGHRGRRPTSPDRAKPARPRAPAPRPRTIRRASSSARSAGSTSPTSRWRSDIATRVRASQIRSPRAASTTEGAPEVGERLAVPAHDHREHVAAAHEATGPDLAAHGLGNGAIELPEPAAGSSVQREGAAERRSDVGEPIGIAAATAPAARAERSSRTASAVRPWSRRTMPWACRATDSTHGSTDTEDELPRAQPSPGRARRWRAAAARRRRRPPGCWASAAPSPTTP